MKNLNKLMKFVGVIIFAVIFIQCSNSKSYDKDIKADNMPDGNYNYHIVFLHHSTGGNVWNGNLPGGVPVEEASTVPGWFTNYNGQNGTAYHIKEQIFPKAEPYGWKNYPHDYYNIWVKNGGDSTFMEEPTLEILTQDYDMVIFKHCFPVSNIQEDTGIPDIDSPEKRIENYKLQYEALKAKMHEFPDKKFIVWTGAALVKKKTSEDNAKRAKEFFDWVRNDWDSENDNIYLWDLYELETEGDLYLQNKNARSSKDPHLDTDFAGKAAKLFSQRIVDIIETNGQKTSLTGEYK
jgi:hypothetical protein